MSGVVKMENRIDKLEYESKSTQRRLDEFNAVMSEISRSTASICDSQKSIALTLEKVNDTMERFRDFEVRTETERKTEREHRDRLDRRVDDFQRDLTNSRKDFDESIDRVYSSVRKIDKTCIKNFNDLDKRLDVKTNVDDVKQANTTKVIDIRGERLWKGLFWVMCFLIAAVYGLTK